MGLTCLSVGLGASGLLGACTTGTPEVDLVALTADLETIDGVAQASVESRVDGLPGSYAAFIQLQLAETDLGVAPSVLEQAVRLTADAQVGERGFGSYTFEVQVPDDGGWLIVDLSALAPDLTVECAFPSQSCVLDDDVISGYVS